MSDLNTALQEYLTIRRHLGFKLRKEGSLLLKFVRFLQEEGASSITRDLALRWAMQPADAHPSWWAIRLRMVRLFAQYQSAADPRTEVPPQGLLPHKYHRKAPHIYSDEEIKQLTEAAKELPSKNGLRPHTYSTLFGLLAVTGMRMNECISLQRKDVDLTQGILTIVQAKFGKSRLLPLHRSTHRVLQQYECRRNQICPNPQDPNFFLSDSGSRLTDCTVRYTFIKISRQIGLRGPLDNHGPRVHDYRHAFAVRTLLNWYRNGVDVEREMPKLATYLGHTHVDDTYWYLSAIPELMHLAMKRMENLEGGLPYED
jgi:site-specific recombinase XerD